MTTEPDSYDNAAWNEDGLPQELAKQEGPSGMWSLPPENLQRPNEPEWKGAWTEAEKKKIRGALTLLNSHIDDLIQDVHNVSRALDQGKYRLISGDLAEYLNVLEGVKTTLNGKNPLKIAQENFGDKSEAEGKYYLFWQYVALNTNNNKTPSINWKAKTTDELASLLLHEISHKYRTVDDNHRGAFMNAHIIQQYYENALQKMHFYNTPLREQLSLADSRALSGALFDAKTRKPSDYSAPNGIRAYERFY